MTSQELKILAKASRDPWFFSNFAKVVNPVLGVVPFILYPFQRNVLYQFMFHQFNVVLKARQMGLTEMIGLYALWLAMFHPHKNIVIISLKDRVAKKLLRRIKHIYMNLPAILQTPIVNGRRGEYGTGCITSDTVLVGEQGNFEIGEITPYKPGIYNISGVKVLTHTGTFERVLRVINKGTLLTYEISNGEHILQCTPDHRLYTVEGWKTVEEVLNKNLTCIFWNSNYLQGIQRTETIKPLEEEVRATKYTGYWVSNLGNVYTSKFKRGKGNGRKFIDYTGTLSVLKSRKGTIKLRLGKGIQKRVRVSRLVYETFMGSIPKGKIIDHINGNQADNYITNLQAISKSQNTKRAYKESRNLVASNYSFKNNAQYSLQDIGVILEALESKKPYKEIHSDTKAVGRIKTGRMRSHISISKIKKVKEFEAVIMDLEVENNHSYITASNFINHNSEMIFSNGSSITSLPTTEDAGRSEAVSLLVMDEAAVMQMADTIWTAAFPTLSTGGSAIINSTPYGVGNWYYNTWTDGIYNINGFNNIKLTWDMHPDRDQAWYDKMRNALGAKRTAQEIDGDFLASGDTVFDLMDIKQIEDDIIDNPPIESRLNGNLLIFKRPIEGEAYFIGVDVSTGRATDYSAFTVMNRRGEEYAAFKGRVPTNRLRDIAMSVGKEYNYALLAIEANDIGEGVVSGAQEHGYPNLYYTEQIVKEKRSSKPVVKKVPGWYTTRANRSVIIDGLERDIADDVVLVKDPFFVTEAYTFIYDTANRPVAMQKGESISGSDATYSDDSIISKCICNHIRKGKYRKHSTTTPPK